MHAQGILTVRGGMTISRSSSCPWYGYLLCIRLRRDQDRRREEGTSPLGGYTFHEGDYISLDGTTGKIYKGDIQTQLRHPLAETSRRIMDLG